MMRLECMGSNDAFDVPGEITAVEILAGNAVSHGTPH